MRQVAPMAALPHSDTSSDDDDFHSMSAQGDPDAASLHSDGDDPPLEPPEHPCPQLQAAFEESIREAAQLPEETDVHRDTDAEMRRRRLLEAEHEGDAPIVRWKQRPGAQYHPFVKLIAQLVFGMHLLRESQARSDEEVVRILQNHVNDVDLFLERTAEDFDLAIKDIDERIRYLKLPMQHMDLFEVMLDEKKFRTDLLNGNEKIERIIARTAQAMNAAMHDIHNGIKSTKELSAYLKRIERRPQTDNPDVAEVFAAMRGNEQGWASYLRDLRTKGDNLRNNLVILETVIGEIARHAAAASRRNKTQGRQVSTGTQVSCPESPLRSRFTKDVVPAPNHRDSTWLDKPLPREPGSNRVVKQAAMAKPHPVPLATRFEQPRQTVPAPPRASTMGPFRPKTAAAGARDPTTQTAETTQELSNFIRNCDPLRSNPPETTSKNAAPGRRRSRRHSRRVGHFPNKVEHLVRKSRSQILRPLTSDNASADTREIRPETAAASDILPAKGPTSRDGFSRRLSERLKHLPAPLLAQTRASAPASILEVAPTRDTTPRPVDSAHSSERDKDSGNERSRPRRTTTGASTPELTALPVRRATDTSDENPRGGHSLFPTTPLTPLDDSPPPLRRNHSMDAKQFLSSLNPSTSSKSRSSKTSRTSNLINFFTYRRERGTSQQLVLS